MDTNDLSEGTKNRLRRIQELRQSTEQEALEYSINTAWLVAENKAMKDKVPKGTFFLRPKEE